MIQFTWAAVISIAIWVLPGAAEAQSVVFSTTRVIPGLRAMIGKPLLDQSIDFNNRTGFVLAQLSPEGARFFLGGSQKEPSESADEMRQSHGLVVLITPCQGVHDLNAKIASISVWETLAEGATSRNGLGLEQLLAIMNTPPSVVTPSTLRVPKVKDLHGLVFEYVRGDTTETVGLVNEGIALRINWNVSNTAGCPR